MVYCLCFSLHHIFKKSVFRLCIFLFSASTNLALGSSTWQSSTANGYDSWRAVDGNRHSNMDVGSCISTEYQSDPYWSVDLGKDAKVAFIRIFTKRNLPGLWNWSLNGIFWPAVLISFLNLINNFF